MTERIDPTTIAEVTPTDRQPPVKSPPAGPIPSCPKNHCHSLHHGQARRPGALCHRTAGYDTPHKGSGRCKYHGGMSRVTNGRKSKLPRLALAELQQNHLDDPKLLDLAREIAGARAVLDLFMQRFGVKLETGRDLANAATVANTASELLERSSRIVERFERIKAQNAISQPDFYRLMREMARVVEQYVPDEATRRKIGEGWLSLQFFPQPL